METTESWRNVVGALDRRHNYSSQGILDNLKTIKRAGRKLIVRGNYSSQAWMKQENSLVSKEEQISRS